jgi:hypothetical protein
MVEFVNMQLPRLRRSSCVSMLVYAGGRVRPVRCIGILRIGVP